MSFELHAKVAEEIDVKMCSYGNCRKFECSVTLTLDRVKVTSTYTQYRNMAIWISWNTDIGRFG